MVHEEIFLNVLYEGKNDLGIPLEHLKVAWKMRLIQGSAHLQLWFN